VNVKAKVKEQPQQEWQKASEKELSEREKREKKKAKGKAGKVQPHALRAPKIEVEEQRESGMTARLKGMLRGWL
jgi:hypothetical protein